MFERPQYMTSDGYKRSKVNPNRVTKVKGVPQKMTPLQIKLLKKELLQRKNNLHKNGISPEAAKVIASAIKMMLHS